MIHARTPNKSATLYKGNFDTEQIEFTRVWAKATAWTFEIYPIKVLLGKYVGNGIGWVDPFAGNNSPAEITNDHNPSRKAKFHLEAMDFCQQLDGQYEGILFDPPYSFTQVKKHYQVLGMPVTKGSTSMAFYSRVKDEMCLKIKDGGYAISFGWNTNGFGRARGFKIVEIMAVAHGGHRNDTIVVVEKKDNTLVSEDFNLTAK